MSEVVKHKQFGFLKLGTCENLYYISYPRLKKELPEMEHVRGNLKPEEYLNPQYGFHYRFPFPDEISLEQAHEDYDRGFEIVIPRRFFNSGEIDIFHQRFFIRDDHHRNFSFGFHIPCPADVKADFKFSDYNDIRKNLIMEIVLQKIVENQLITITRCPFCKQCSAMSEEEITILHHIIHREKDHYDDFTKQVISIALAGYKEFAQ